MNYSTDNLYNDETFIFVAAIIMLLIVMVALFVNSYISFKKERDYIRMEMARSYREKEYCYWERKMKCLYLRYIPLIGRLFR